MVTQTAVTSINLHGCYVYIQVYVQEFNRRVGTRDKIFFNARDTFEDGWARAVSNGGQPRACRARYRRRSSESL